MQKPGKIVNDRGVCGRGLVMRESCWVGRATGRRGEIGKSDGILEEG